MRKSLTPLALALALPALAALPDAASAQDDGPFVTFEVLKPEVAFRWPKPR